MARERGSGARSPSSSALAFEAELLASANGLQGSRGCSGVQTQGPGPIFLERTSDALKEHPGKLEGICRNGCVPNSGSCVGTEEREENGEPFEDKMARL